MSKLTTAILLVVGLSSTLRSQRPQEGIKVHGHWTIDIRQPDGTLATHREFENSLITVVPSSNLNYQSGNLLLASILRDPQPSAGSWYIVLGADVGVQSPCDESFTGRVSPFGGEITYNTQAACVVPAYASNGGSGQTILNGTTYANHSGTIAQVLTTRTVTNTSPDLYVFTGAILSERITQITIDQVIQVKVTISFS